MEKFEDVAMGIAFGKISKTVDGGKTSEIYITKDGGNSFNKLEIINSDSSYKIRKLKEYDGIDYNEEKLFNELFYSSDEINVADIYKLPYISLRKIKDNITREENIYKVYEKNSFKVKRIIFVISVLL